jgi:CO dehydrogenase/acetyl-CoA synthase epsilon subunit
MTASCTDIIRFLKSQENILILAGDLCTRIRINGKGLCEYVLDLSKKTNAPIAATGNSISELEGKDVVAGKMWVSEILNDLRGLWQDKVVTKRPKVLVLIGYNPDVAQRLIGATRGVVETIFLGTRFVEEATFSLPDSSLKEFGANLKEIIEGFKPSSKGG